MARSNALAGLLAALLAVTITSPHHSGGIHVAAGDHGVTFLYPNLTLFPPPPNSNMTIHYLDYINVTYISPFATPLLFIFCSNGGHNIRYETVPPFNGSHLVLANWTESTPCYFDLRPDKNPGHGANSDSFFIDVAVGGQTTASMTPLSTTPGITSLSTTTTGPTTTSTDAAAVHSPGGTDSPAAPAGLSTGAQAGIGVGVSLAVLVVGGLAGAWLWRRKRHGGAAGRRRVAELDSPEATGSTEKRDMYAAVTNVRSHELGGTERPPEMEGNTWGPRHELA